VSEEVEELKAVEVAGIEAVEDLTLWPWDEGVSDWVNPETGEALTGYIPSEQANELIKNIFLNLGELKAGKPKPLAVGNVKPKQTVEPTFLDIDLEAHRNRVFSEMDALEFERAANQAAPELPFEVPTLEGLDAVWVGVSLPEWKPIEVPTLEGLDAVWDAISLPEWKAQ